MCGTNFPYTRSSWTAYKAEVKVTLRPTVSRPVCLGIKHPSGVYNNIFITVGQLRVCWCGALSLTRGRVENLYSVQCSRFLLTSDLQMYNIRGYLIVSEHRLYRVTPLKTPFGLLIPLLQSQSHVTTFTHNYLVRGYAFTQLTITYTFVTTITYDTLALADFSAINYCLELSQTLHLNTSKPSPRSYSANSLLLKHWFLHSHSGNCFLKTALVELLPKTNCLDISIPLINPQSY
jgi:hypothetical protein